MTLNPRTYMQIHIPIVVKDGGGGGWMEPPRVFTTSLSAPEVKKFVLSGCYEVT